MMFPLIWTFTDESRLFWVLRVSIYIIIIELSQSRKVRFLSSRRILIFNLCEDLIPLATNGNLRAPPTGWERHKTMDLA